MPRPRVRPEDRQRAAKACLPCKASKKRCDAQQPCSNCVRRRSTSSCVYAGSMHVRPDDGRRKFINSSTHEPQSSHALSVEESDPSAGSPQYATARLHEPAATPQRLTRGRLLLNSKGEKVYVGETASLSFLQFLRHIIRQQMGPSIFTENTRRNVMLEVNTPEDTNSHFIEDEMQKRPLVDVYFAATNGLLDLFSRDEIEELLTTRVPMNHGGPDYTQAALDLIIAIGGQCRASSSLDLRYAVRYFSRAQKTAFAAALEDPCLDMVRCFLLLAFYMFGACRRNAALMYLGVASQASTTLGLHVTEQYRHFSIRDQSIRLRTLKSLRIMDVVSHSILGRPYSTPAIRIDSASFSSMHIHVGKPRDLALNASFGASSVIAEIIQRLDSANSCIEPAAAERFLRRLQDWSSSLPSDIRQFSQNPDSPLTLLDREQIIGSIHVSCVYYFAVMLVTRPFLITHLMSHLPGNAAETPDPVTTSTKDPPDVVNLAQACIDSAIYMAQMCYEALQSGILLNNMCIMKAWMFAAGLVLGFSMFAQREARYDMDESFNGAREVLKKLSEHSPQAEHYYEILTGFADAIQRHRQHLSREKRRSNNRYVNQILTLDVSRSVAGSQARLSPGTLPRGPADGASTSETDPTAGARFGEFDYHGGASHPQFQMPDVTQLPIESGGGFDFGLFGWDNFAMQISENFSLDNESAWNMT
ncbi:uncharacterized protein Z518_10469 [Rhinocladiella mackenziei CBS 650.93]|uniref:Zn(2)-C6 fungal-type domain-containing protein n=1 Tax=Rhinocladiella mackenziei CBS 650.93 TaxID=1442369 RepID=A0A0D2IUC3_9EURO|nr:uncharacterized protein Z518_10469 [Rhinocladiella mackenziei CBS 650.93]KIX00330.1 hypothetical protein Z518_10469 [Rhinocladiella mackenziei CBS 650.93]